MKPTRALLLVFLADSSSDVLSADSYVMNPTFPRTPFFGAPFSERLASGFLRVLKSFSFLFQATQ